jgi:hypothetical protein
MTTASDRFRVARARSAPARWHLNPASGIPDGKPRTVTEEVNESMPICRRCGWPRGGPGCRAAHRLNPAIRMWSRREWLRYRRTGRLPAWDYTSRRDRRARRGAR